MPEDMQASTPAPEAVVPATLLFVDDEPNMLSALRRLFHPLGHQMLVAGSGAEALEVMQAQPVDVLITDMRMPEMSGAQLLAQVVQRWPDTMRILLTGYADMDSAIAAINNGHIYGYYTKPWEDEELRLGVINALREKRLVAKQRRLVAELAARNQELRELNASLDAKVQLRTAQLQSSFSDTVRAFSQLVELRKGAVSGHARRVSDQARKVAVRLSLPEQEVQILALAGLLLQVGKVTLPEKLLSRPISAMGNEEREQYMRHAAVGASVLGPIGPLRAAAKLIGSQFECIDGSGLPEGLAGEQIPLGARILAVVRDYDLMLEGAVTGKPMPPGEAQGQLRRLRGKKYDPSVLEALFAIVGEVSGTHYRRVIKVGLLDLVPNMEVAEVVVGAKVLLRDVVLTEEMIKEIGDIARNSTDLLEIRIRPRK
jgi:response regulator RpfG family c-di-GMP phosphodiesterase